MHDPGDEDRGELRNDCPFCGCSLYMHRRWSTPVFPPMRYSFEEAAALPGPLETKCEILVTCLACKWQARRFAELQREPADRKNLRARMAAHRW